MYILDDDKKGTNKPEHKSPEKTDKMRNEKAKKEDKR